MSLCVAVHFNMVQYGSGCCSILQCGAVYCSVLQCAAACCSVLQCVMVCDRVLECDVRYCNTQQHTVTHGNTFHTDIAGNISH